MPWNKTALILGATSVLVMSSRPVVGQEKRGPNFDGVSMHLGDTLMAPVAPHKRPREDGLVLEAEFDFRRLYLLGEPLVVRCSLANYGSTPVTLSYGERGLQKNSIFFDIKGPDGNLAPRLVIEKYDSAGPQPLVIEPGWRLVEWYNLLDGYGMAKAGDYEIGVRYESDGSSVHPGSGKILDDLWKGKLEWPLGTVGIVEPSEAEDKAALEWLTANSPFGKGAPNRRYVSLFDAADEPRFATFLKEHSKSQYAAYARYGDGLGALLRASRGATAYTKQAIENLGAIAPAGSSEPAPGYPLFRERVLFHLIQAHKSASSKPEVIDALVREFLDTYPQSPFGSLLQETGP